MSEPMEPPIEGTVGDIHGMTIEWLFRSPGFAITRWDCAPGRRELSEEKRQLWHVISFVHAGAFVLHMMGRSALIDSTSIVLYNPGVPSQSEHPFGCCDHGSAIVVRREVLLAVMGQYDRTAEERPHALFLQAHAYGFSHVYVCQRLLVQHLSQGTAQDPLAVESAVFGLLGEIAAGCARLNGRSTAGRRDPSRARRDYVEDAKALLQQRFRERLWLDEIARALHVSTHHLCRIFKQETGVPIHRYLNRLRLREALELIAGGKDDLADLALGLGFSSHSHFTAAFRKEFGVTPRDVRRLGITPT